MVSFLATFNVFLLYLLNSSYKAWLVVDMLRFQGDLVKIYFDFQCIYFDILWFGNKFGYFFHKLAYFFQSSHLSSP